MKASELLAAEPWFKVLIYGDSGTGKTTWACQAPRPLILLNERAGLPSINLASPDAEVAMFSTFDHVRAAVGRLAEAERVELDNGEIALRTKGKGGDVFVQTLVLDSLTRAAELARVAATADEDDGTSLREFGHVVRLESRLLDALRDLPCNVICVALTKETGGEAGIPRRTVPSLYGGDMRLGAGAWFSAVGYAHKREGAFAIGWRLGDRWITKTPATPRPFPPIHTFGVNDGRGTLGAILGYIYPDLPSVARDPRDQPSSIEDALAAQRAAAAK